MDWVAPPPWNIHIEILSDYDLVTILSNLIDNSIDAVNTNISEERQIILRIKEVKNNLVIKRIYKTR